MPHCPVCAQNLEESGSLLKCGTCASFFPAKNLGRIAMNTAEINQEAQRVRGLISSGAGLVVGESALALALENTLFHGDFAPDPNSPGDLGPYDFVLLPYPMLGPDDLLGVLKKMNARLSQTGLLRILVYASSCPTVTGSKTPLATALTKQALIRLLSEAGFKAVVLDTRSFVRARRIMSGFGKESIFSKAYALPAWLQARLSQGAILAATAWK